MRLGLQGRWFGTLAVVWAALLTIISISLGLSLPAFLKEKINEGLQRELFTVRFVLEQELARPQPDRTRIHDLARQLGQSAGTRVTVIAADGTVIGESEKTAAELSGMENHLQRPEVQEALEKGVGSSTRHSDTLNVDLLYLAATVPASATRANVRAFVRVALPLYQVSQTVSRVRWTVTAAIITVGLLAVPVLFWLTRRFSRPLLEMRAVAGRVAQDDFSRRASPRAPGELGELAVALNDMAAQLDARLRELSAEKSELSAVLSSMTEGVLVVDASARIRLANRPLREQFQLGDAAVGRTVLEAFRNAPLHELVAEAISGSDIAGRELATLSPAERTFEVSAARLHQRDGAVAGAVVVFHDITRIKRLESVRKEFVANVSHELRTPLSILKGCVETLLEEPGPDAATARQFLQTVQRHTRRLEALIADLLTISALESQQARLQLEPLSLRAAAESAAEELARQAQEKKIAIEVGIAPDLPAARADAQRLQQVFFNLLDNAVKYIQPGGRVSVSAKAADAELEVCVADDGPGIASQHLPRIFERFYRVDKARSREMGGTGLGLAIVKHIIQAHGGRVWADSELEQGSRFYFTLSKADAP